MYYDFLGVPIIPTFGTCEKIANLGGSPWGLSLTWKAIGYTILIKGKLNPFEHIKLHYAEHFSI